MMAKRYQVTAACVTHIPGPSLLGSGTALGTLYQDAILPPGVPADRIKHLLDNGLIAECGEDAPAATAES